MAIGKIVKNVIVTTAVMFAVGALLAVAAPLIAEATGVAVASLGHTADPLWLGSFFGTFGGLHAAIKPVFDRSFKMGEYEAREVAPTPCQLRQMQKQKTVEPEVQPQQKKQGCGHCQALKARRSAEVGAEQRSM